MHKGFITLLFLLASACGVFADTINAASGTRSAIQTAVDASSAGDTIAVPAGTFSFGSTSSVTMAGQRVLKGAGIGNTIINMPSSGSDWYWLSVNVSGNDAFEIYGLEIRGSAGSGGKGGGIKVTNSSHDFRIHNNRFENIDNWATINLDYGDWRGVIDHNEFVHCFDQAVWVAGVKDASAWSTTTIADFGTANAVFVEDNYFRQGSLSSTYTSHHTDGQYGATWVFRYNTIDEIEQVNSQAIGIHGGRPPFDNNNRGNRFCEIYGNTLDAGNRWRAIQWRGGDGLIWGNQFDGTYNSNISIEIKNEDSGGGEGDCGSYPCTDQIRFLYLWDNTQNGTAITSSFGFNNHHPGILQLNRDYFFATPGGYTPYTYPHPLVTGGGGDPPPTAPSSLSATAASTSQINLTWVDNSNDETGFKIERENTQGGFTQIATATAGAESYSDADLPASTFFNYRVRAYNASGNSGYSNEDDATTSTVSGTPTQLTVADVTASGDDGNIALNTLDNNLNTRWSSLGDGEWIRFDLGQSKTVSYVAAAWYLGDARTSSFDIDYSTDGTNWTTDIYAGISSGVTQSQENYDFNDVTARYIRITGHGNTSNLWNSITEVDIYGIEPASAPDAPSSLSATAVSASQINLTWVDNSDDETGFKIERKTGSGGTYAQIATVGSGVEQYNNASGLTASTEYYYRVRAYNAAGNSAYSNEDNATTQASGGETDYTVSGLTISDVNPHYFKYQGDHILLTCSGGNHGSSDFLTWNSVLEHDLTLSREKLVLYDVTEGDADKPYSGNRLQNGFNESFWTGYQGRIDQAKAAGVMVYVTLFMSSVIEAGTGRWDVHLYNDAWGGPINDEPGKEAFYTLHDANDLEWYKQTFNAGWNEAQKVQWYQQQYVYKAMQAARLIETTTGNDNVVFNVLWEAEDDNGGALRSKVISFVNHYVAFIKNLNPTILVSTAEGDGCSEFSCSLFASWAIEDLNIDFISRQNRPATTATLQDLKTNVWDYNMPVVFLGTRWYEAAHPDGDDDDAEDIVTSINQMYQLGFNPSGPFDGFYSTQPNKDIIFDYLREVQAHFATVENICDEPGQEIVAGDVPDENSPYSYTDGAAGVTCDDGTTSSDVFNPPYPRINQVYFYEPGGAFLDVWQYHTAVTIRYNQFTNAQVDAIDAMGVLVGFTHDKLVPDKDEFDAGYYIYDGNQILDQRTDEYGYINITTSHPGVGGKKGYEFIPEYLAQNSYLNGTVKFIVYDFLWPEWYGPDADITGDFINESASAIDVPWTNGVKQLILESREQFGLEMIGGHETKMDELNGYFNEFWSKSNDTNAEYELLEMWDHINNAAQPQVNNCGCDRSRNDLSNFFRFDFWGCTITGAYFGHNEGTTAHRYTYIHDEYLANMGYPTSTLVNLKANVYYRTFTNGIMIINASNSANAAVNVSEIPGSTYYKFYGQQDNNFNDGSQFTNITLSAPDGIGLFTEPTTLIAPVIVDNAQDNMTGINQDAASVVSGTWTEVHWPDINSNGSNPYNVGVTWSEDFTQTRVWTTNVNNQSKAYMHTTGTGTVDYDFNLNISGTAAVKIWYPNQSADGATADTNVEYQVTHAGGTDSYYVNQQTNTGQWVFLDSLQFNAGSPRVRLIADSNTGRTAADAIGLFFPSDVADITPPPPDGTPYITPISNITVQAGALVSFQVTESGGDAPISLSVTGNVAGGTAASTYFTDNGNRTGNFNWQTATGDQGVYNLNFIAMDNDGDSDAEQVTITVQAPASADSIYFHYDVDNISGVWINGNAITPTASDSDRTVSRTVTVATVAGENVIAVKGTDLVGHGAAVFEITIGANKYYSNTSWKVNTAEFTGWQNIGFNDNTWNAATDHGQHGLVEPWATSAGNFGDLPQIPDCRVIWTPNLETDDVVYLRKTITLASETIAQKPAQRMNTVN